jgi:hypothetical protein
MAEPVTWTELAVSENGCANPSINRSKSAMACCSRASTGRRAATSARILALISDIRPP